MEESARIGLDAFDAAALHAQGRRLLAEGRAEEALRYCEEAIRRGPAASAWYDTLGSVLRSLGRIEGAIEAYRAAIQIDSQYAPAYANLGVILLEQDRAGEALQYLPHAVGLDPQRAVYWEYLARIYEWQGRADLAIPCWERVQTLMHPPQRRVHLALGRALHDEGRLDEAERQYLAALEIEAKDPVALAHVGKLHAERGETERAEALFRRALQLKPDYDWSYAWLAALLGGKLPDADLERIVARLEVLGTRDENRVRLLFACGQVFDARGEYPRASACFREANALAASQRPTSRRYDAAAEHAFVDEVIQRFDRAQCARLAGSRSRTPVFIVGLPRSGTTLIEQILAAHPQVHGAGELAIAERMFESLPEILGVEASATECAAILEPEAIGLIAENYLAQLKMLAPANSHQRVIDKQPGNYNYLGFIASLFPEATIIHCRRDLRDVALSCWNSDFATIRWSNDPVDIAAHFRAHQRLMEHWRETLQTTIHEVWYEEAVEDVEKVAHRLIDAMGLQWDPICLDFHQSKRAVRTASRTQVRQPVHRRSVGRWEFYRDEFPELFEGLGRLA